MVPTNNTLVKCTFLIIYYIYYCSIVPTYLFSTYSYYYKNVILFSIGYNIIIYFKCINV